jgi:hypothetical protein
MYIMEIKNKAFGMVANTKSFSLAIGFVTVE